MTLFGGIVVAIILIGLMATLHEMGHYIVGRRLGFTVDSVQIFMGPKLVSWKRHGIDFSLHLLPLGAAVKFKGDFDFEEDRSAQEGEEDDEEENGDGLESDEPRRSDDPGAFGNRPKLARAAVLLAGPLMNILTGVLAFFICFALIGYTIPVVSAVEPSTQAAAAGLQPGDIITRANGTPVGTDMDIGGVLTLKGQLDPVDLTVRRGDKDVHLTLTPKIVKRPMLGITMKPGEDGSIEVVDVMQESNNGSPVLRVGDKIKAVDGEPVTADMVAAVLKSKGDKTFTVTVHRGGLDQDVKMKATMIDTVDPEGIILTRSHDLLRAIPYSFQYSWSILRVTGQGLGQLITGHLRPQDALAGPVGIVTMVSGVVTEQHSSVADKVVQLLQLFALISLSLGFTNLLPIPLLDGNKLLLLLVEAIRGKSLSYKAQSIISIVGLVMILGLFALAMFSDVWRLLHH